MKKSKMTKKEREVMIKRIMDWINKKQFERLLNQVEIEQRVKNHIESKRS